ncbi:Hypothetical predicted protein, partial [Pelobates cultripes]
MLRLSTESSSIIVYNYCLSTDLLSWIRKEVTQGISEALEVRKRSEKRPRQRQDSSQSFDSEGIEPMGEFEVLDQIDSSDSGSKMMSEALDSKLILMVRKSLEIPEDVPKVEGSDKHFADLNKQRLSFPLR